MRDDTLNYRQLFLNDTPMIDLRAPVEFKQGAFPSAVSLPLMSDEEREKVGTCYKQQGQDAAIKLGHKLVSGDIKEQRMAAWKAFVEENPEGYLYCFRGGLRSRTTQQWLKEAGADYPLVTGGYKALRNFLLDEIEATCEALPFYIVGGNTGCRKTPLINSLKNAVDLEGAANHRGSSFGRYVTPQRSQINFENKLAIDLLKLRNTGISELILEDEGRIIGSVDIPHSLHLKMQQAPIIVVEEDLETRLHNLLQEYVIDMHRSHTEHYGQEQGNHLCAEYLLSGLDKIRKRLGSERWRELRKMMEQAIATHDKGEGYSQHLNWLSPLLEWYYDPMYSYQLGNKANRIVYRGNWQECQDYLHNIT
ncbi:tRNA 2-selenouridine(34) synthase MnmH [Aliamphritea hakodatensis]|uniref:tRNA 2-selenouridine(34) synthase MnmH n=1 Tax=Aliamphritea hakodatensis TaxID=2895352 RepID=UPI0022FD82E3|nr:tRNA 2-selenouridine(34) synthase MnmH [Aliamphritea hakodatensis]